MTLAKHRFGFLMTPLFALLAATIVSCGTPATSDVPVAIPVEATKQADTSLLSVPLDKGMNPITQSQAELIESLGLGFPAKSDTASGDGTLKALNYGRCSDDVAGGNQGQIVIYRSGGNTYNWYVGMYQPYLWTTYSAKVYIGNQLYGTYGGSGYNQPSGSFTGFSGPFSGVLITSFARGLGVAYGTLTCTI